ncbi:SAM-dependent methyltransferase [Lichenicoccus sp.]|uniref:SAM-dependent methyltransferase n=1 Tax=Lichenicoccus sp. TaxID=2781899 RepID=UPI003D0A27D8
MQPVRAAYLADALTQPVLAEELRRLGVGVLDWHGLLALSPDPPRASAWALDVWTEPELVACHSIGLAATALRDRQRNWSLYPAAQHRRCALIAARLPTVKAAPLRFPAPMPTAPLGAWTLLALDRMLLSRRKTSPFVNGACRFVEDRTGPPSRAYLKLWEACTRLGAHPGPGDRCIDLGAAPGGWSWALAQLGAEVIAVDKADLAPEVAALPNVTLRRESAFGLQPEQEPETDWLFSDVIAYPERLLGLVSRWIAAGRTRRIVCSIKFQGATDHALADRFAAIAGAMLIHLAHNKHELTFMWRRPPPAPP